MLGSLFLFRFHRNCNCQCVAFLHFPPIIKMLGKGVLSPEMVEGAQSGLQRGIEELRVKYEKIEAQKQAVEAEKAASERAAFQASAAGKAAEEALRVDMRMEDPEVERLRQERLTAMKNARKKMQQGAAEGCGELREIAEDEFLKEVTNHQFVVVHFYHAEFMTCKVMDKHLRILAPRCMTTKFLKIDASRSPFFVAKLKIKTLPSLAFFLDGVVVGRQTGFEGLISSATDEDFPTPKLHQVLRFHGMLGLEEMKAAREELEGDGDDAEDYETSEGGQSSAFRDLLASRMKR